MKTLPFVLTLALPVVASDTSFKLGSPISTSFQQALLQGEIQAARLSDRSS